MLICIYISFVHLFYIQLLMKVQLFILILFFTFTSFGQCVIKLNPNSCAGNTGLVEITSGEIYNAYQWYYKPINSTSTFQPILNSTSPNFTFNWATYDQSIIKVLCIYNSGISYFSTDVVLDQANCNLGTLNYFSNISDVKLYPNPAKEYIELTNLESNSQIEIFNSLGQEVLHLNYSQNSKINITDFLPGVYFLRIKTENALLNFKFSKT